MRENKGFTLIELLAVIVILAIIALIATPVILGIIEDSRKSANERSAELVKAGVQNAYTSYLMRYNGSYPANVGAFATSDFYNVESAEIKNWTTTEVQIDAGNNVTCTVKKKTSENGKIQVICSSDNDVFTQVTPTSDVAPDAKTRVYEFSGNFSTGD